jgi:hypothetical protein
LQILQDATNIVLEPLGQFGDVLVRKQRHKIPGLGRITPQDFDGLLSLEDAGYLVARQEHRNPTTVSRHPFNQLLLCMGVRPIHFIEKQAERLGIVAHQGRNATSVLT